jgi:hypothetical protein
VKNTDINASEKNRRKRRKNERKTPTLTLPKRIEEREERKKEKHRNKRFRKRIEKMKARQKEKERDRQKASDTAPRCDAPQDVDREEAKGLGQDQLAHVGRLQHAVQSVGQRSRKEIR